MSKTTTYLVTALISSIVITTLLAVVATPLAYADTNPQGCSTGNPHQDDDTGNPHSDDNPTGNPHKCHHNH